MKAAGCLIVCIVLAGCYGQSTAANLLFMSLVPSPSHNIWMKTLAMGLRQRGHTITYVTHSNEKNTENFTAIVIEGIYEKLTAQFDYEAFSRMGPLTMIPKFYKLCHFVCELSLKTNGIKQLMKQVEDNVKYDLIVFDLTSGQCFYPFIEKFGSPPVVGASPFGLQYYLSSSFGNDIDASFNPLYLLPYTDQMTFFERFNNYFYTMLSVYWHNYVYMPNLWKLTEEIFGKDIMHYREIEKNISFVLVNYDPNFDYPRSIPPAVIPAGGLHTRRGQPLNNDLKYYLDNSKDGIILFSLGSNIRSDSIDIDKRNALIKAFSKLKQNVLWKFESDIENLPPNVIVRPWLPQNDILAHPNVKLFITHGGALSTQEAMYHAMPVVGIPFFADQYVNIHKLTMRNLGLTLDYNTLTAETALDIIKEVLNNPIYKRKMVEVSRRYRDQPEDALTRSVFWVEYALRHGGAEHLSIAPRDMHFYQLYYLDIWAVILAVILAAIVILYIIVRKLCRGIISPAKSTKLKSN